MPEPDPKLIAREVSALMGDPDSALELHRQLTEALYPFGREGEVPTAEGHYDVLRNGNPWHLRHINGGWYRATGGDTVPIAAWITDGDKLRFAVRPTRKPPAPASPQRQR